MEHVIPCCVALVAVISVKCFLLAAVAPLTELGDVGTGGGSKGSGMNNNRQLSTVTNGWRYGTA